MSAQIKTHEDELCQELIPQLDLLMDSLEHTAYTGDSCGDAHQKIKCSHLYAAISIIKRARNTLENIHDHGLDRTCPDINPVVDERPTTIITYGAQQ